MILSVELPENVMRELDERHISSQEVSAFVVEAIEAWLRMQSENSGIGVQSAASRFGASATPFVEKLVRENRELFERLGQL